MIYKFKVAYTKLGVGTAPGVAPTCTVVDADDNILANAQPTTALANMTGVYLYSYNGADGLDTIALFHTTDLTMDQPDLYSYTSDFITDLTDAMTIVDGIVDDILVDTGTDGVLIADDAITSDAFDEATAFPVESADAGATEIARVGADGDTLETLSDQLDGVSTLGVGAFEWDYILKDNLGAFISDADIWVTSDVGGTTLLASGRTDVAGNVTFWLDAGATVYVWGQKSGYNFDNPDTEVVA